MPHVEQLVAGDHTASVHLRIPDGAAAGVVVLHAWWGLNEDVIAYADRLAGAGYAVAAPDMFHGQVATERADAERLSQQGDAGGADAIALAAVDLLASRLGGSARLAVLGFSFGAGYAIWAPSERDRLVATVVYYGAWAGPFVTRSTAALLGHFAERDEFTSDDEIREMEEAYRAAGREATTHRYPGTGHWFAEPSRTDAYSPEAAELAFSRTREFLDEKLRP
jgi:carboxymethylenebutenolidase